MADQLYLFCKCGRSLSQPFCDGSHADSAVSPIEFAVPHTRSYQLCGCKKSKQLPFCDSTHRGLNW